MDFVFKFHKIFWEKLFFLPYLFMILMVVNMSRFFKNFIHLDNYYTPIYNGDPSIWMKNTRVGRKTTNKHTRTNCAWIEWFYLARLFVCSIMKGWGFLLGVFFTCLLRLRTIYQSVQFQPQKAVGYHLDPELTPPIQYN